MQRRGRGLGIVVLPWVLGELRCVRQPPAEALARDRLPARPTGDNVGEAVPALQNRAGADVPAAGRRAARAVRPVSGGRPRPEPAGRPK
eukprot:13347460-Alexandrium_andersonii.AAC.1